MLLFSTLEVKHPSDGCALMEVAMEGDTADSQLGNFTKCGRIIFSQSPLLQSILGWMGEAKTCLLPKPRYRVWR